METLEESDDFQYWVSAYFDGDDHSQGGITPDNPDVERAESTEIAEVKVPEPAETEEETDENSGIECMECPENEDEWDARSVFDVVETMYSTTDENPEIKKDKGFFRRSK